MSKPCTKKAVRKPNNIDTGYCSVISIDPGKSTGVCLYNKRSDHNYLGTIERKGKFNWIDFGKQIQDIRVLIKNWQPDLIIVENISHWNRGGKSSEAARQLHLMIGAIVCISGEGKRTELCFVDHLKIKGERLTQWIHATYPDSKNIKLNDHERAALYLLDAGMRKIRSGYHIGV